jgi:hypothetical protein
VEVGELDRPSVLVGEREVGRLVTGLDHERDLTGVAAGRAWRWARAIR